MSDESKSKVVVIINDDEHEILKRRVKISRRTLGQELAFLAFSTIRAQKGKKKAEVPA